MVLVVPCRKPRGFKPLFTIAHRLMTVRELADFFMLHVNVVACWTGMEGFPKPVGVKYPVDEVMHWLSRR